MNKDIIRRLLVLGVMMVWVLCCMADREVSSFNREWRFFLGDVTGAEKTDFDDGNWQPVGLPHSFGIPYFMSEQFYTGYGWYRKHFVVSGSKGDISNSDWFLEFDGAFQVAEVFVNGVRAGEHRGGYTGFSVDISHYVKLGDNVVAVRVNNLWDAQLAPRAGEHNFNGGIYRSVRLVKTGKTHFDYAGTTIKIEGLEESDGAVAHVSALCKYQGTASVRLTILDADGKVVTRSMDNSCSVSRPNLWSPDSPYLYKAVVSLVTDGKIVDEESFNLGFRWMKWTADQGFFLNGKHFVLRGANVHQDQAGWGDAVTEEAARRDVRMVKEAGFNMIRGSHYPHSPYFVDECDRQGILFWSEYCFWGTGGRQNEGSWSASAYPIHEEDEAAFEQSVLTQLTEMTTQFRNNPSVFVWSMCNEAFFTNGSTLDKTKALLAKEVALTHQLDPSRKAAIGGSQRPLGNDRLDKIGDIAGYNGDGATIQDFQDPGIPNIVSEYGSTYSNRPGKYIPGWGDLSKDDGWKGRTWRSGQVIWCMFDHGSIFGEQMGKLGIVDYFRLPKRSWYWYRNEYRNIAPPEWPVDGTPAKLLLSAPRTKKIKADGTDDVFLVVTVLNKNGKEITATPDVTLRILSGGGEFPTGRSITFHRGSDIDILDGKCAISMRSYFSGKTIIEASSAELESSRLEVEFVGAPKYKKGVSQQVEYRPYKRYDRKQNDEGTEVFGLMNPTFCSTSAKGHSAGNAADGHADTYWEPASGDSSPYITLDTERSVVASSVEYDLQGTDSCTLECSMDGQQWQKFAPGCTLRFVRMSFASSDCKPRLYRFTVVGKLK